MTIPTRRRLLRAGAAIAGVVGGVGATGVIGAQPEVDELSVSITETEDPVGAGDFLRLTTDLENPTDSDIRTGLVLEVGEDPETIERRELTVPAGERRSVRQGFYTYPVPRDASFPVRVVTDGPHDETTVSVRGASPLPASRPDDSLTVAPETDVLFEADVPDTPTQTIWWLDDSQETSGVGGPWRAAYASETGFEYWRHTFETAGSFDVAAAVVPDDADETFAARWTVEVDAGGNTSPTVDDASPATDTVSFDREAECEFELTVSDPDGDLDRVVWWLTQADVILDVTDLEGETDTATLTTDAGCHTCQIRPWVIASDGTITTADGWILEQAREDGTLDISIRTTNDPVPAGDTLEIVVDLENGTDEPVADDLRLVVGDDPETVDTQAISLGPGESGVATLSFDTAPVSTEQTFPIRVDGPDETAETTVTVVA